MFKKTLKKALALSLAVAMAFSGAQIAGVGGADTAAAAEAVSFTDTKTVNVMTSAAEVLTVGNLTAVKTAVTGITTVTATSANEEIATVDFTAADGSSAPDLGENDNIIKVTGVKEGTTSLDIEGKDANGDVLASQTVPVVVKALKKSVTVKKGSDTVTDLTYVAGKWNLKLDATPNNIALTSVKAKTSNAKVAKVVWSSSAISQGDGLEDDTAASGESLYVETLKAGAATITFFDKDDATEAALATVAITVIDNTSVSVSLDGKTYTYTDGAWDSTPIISLTNSSQSAQVTGTSSTGTKVTYEFGTSTTKMTVSNTGKVDAVLLGGKIQPEMNTLNVIAAADGGKGTDQVAAPIDVLMTDESAKLVSVSVANAAGSVLTHDDGAGTITKAEAQATVASIASNGEVTGTDATVADIGTVSELILSTQDKTSETLKITSNVDDSYITVTSSDTDTIAVDGFTLTAKKPGTAAITVKANPDNQSVQNFAQVTFTVSVSNKNVNNAITISSDNPINLSKSVKEAQITAAATDETAKLAFACVGKKNDDGTYTNVPTGNISVSGTGLVTFVDTTTSGTEYIKVSAAETDKYAAALPVYVAVSYNGAKVKSDLTVASTKLEVKVGETVSAGATSSQTLSYTSDDTSVAIVGEDGTITGVAEGTAFITITAAGNDDFEPGEKIVAVKVVGSAKKANTLTVTGKTATVKANKKTGKTAKKKTLKRSAVLTVSKAKGTVTYAKKSGNSKITIAKSTGKVTVKKGLKTGTYKVKVAVTAAGNDTYKAKTVTKTFKIKVKK